MKKNFLIKKFFQNSLKNLKSKKIFYKYNKKSYSYKDLNNFYIRFLNYISHFSNSRKKIATIAEKNFEMYSSIVSIILSKNIWIPINPNLPKKRIENILKECQPDFLLVNDVNEKNNLYLKKFCRNKEIILTDFKKIKKSAVTKKKFNEKKIDDNDISMIFFTSGSTGDPKGVLINYRGFLSSLFEQDRIIFKNKKNLIFGDYHDPSFIISLNILLLCFFTKSTIVPAINPYDSFLPINHLKENKINVLITVPSTLIRLKNYLKANKISNIFEIIIMCGEPFYLDLYKFILEKINSKNVFNCYGSTELSPWVFSHKCKKSDIKTFNKFKLIPIGKPFRYTKTLIKKNELLISGKMLSSGYLNKNENKEKFVKTQNIFWYKTGDLSEIYKNQFIVKGRKDRVVKIKGFRVDLTEIEKFLRDIEKIQNAVCLVKEKNKEKNIICLIQSENKISIDKIIFYLNKHIPFYMIPKKFYFIKKFPLNKSGKLDRKNILKLYQ